MIFFWILLVILLGVGISVMINFSFEAGETKGVWALSFIRATQEAEKDLLIRDSKATEIAKQVGLELSSSLFKEDLGCGIINDVPIWNRKERFCPLNLEEQFTRKFNSLYDAEELFNYAFSFSEEELIGKTEERKVVSALNPNIIPTEERSPGLFTSYEALLIKPFDLKYNYNPSFRIKVNFPFSDYYELEKQAQSLVQECQGEENLKSCLDLNQKVGWSYGKCDSETYLEEERKVIFCTEKKEGEKLNFALDFTSPRISSPKEVQVSLQGTQVKVSFNFVKEAETYNLYYTNWDPAPLTYPQEAKSLFFASQGEYFYLVRELDLPSECPTEHQVNVPYLCGGKVLYWLEDPKIVTGTYYFGITSTWEGEESLLYDIQRLDYS